MNDEARGRPGSAVAGREPAVAAPRRPVGVLLVDDDGDHRDVVRRGLAGAAVALSTASTGDEALATIDAGCGVDVVLLGDGLGTGGGLDVLRAIRRRADPPAVVVVTRTASAAPLERIRAGAADCVVRDDRYAAGLPAVVERARRQCDLERRARVLQRVTAVVASARDRDGALGEVVRGARLVLDADECEVVLAGEDAAAGALADGAADALCVPVAVPESGRLGTLVVRRPGGSFSAEERALAATFASFAAIVVGQLHQLELERSLVAELQQTLDVRRQLVARVSHELRTPLTAIVGFAHTLTAHWERIADPDRRDMVQRVKANSQELAALVEQLLDFASIEAGRLRVDVGAVDVAPLLAGAVADLSPLLAERTVVVDAPAGLVASADPALVRRVLSNLLANAAKYTAPEAAIAVRGAQFAGGVRVEVADTGAGMHPDDAARAFEPFWRGEATRNLQRGTGIGLALVRDYVRLMGGEVGVDTAPGQGAVFWFTLLPA